MADAELLPEEQTDFADVQEVVVLLEQVEPDQRLLEELDLVGVLLRQAQDVNEQL